MPVQYICQHKCQTPRQAQTASPSPFTASLPTSWVLFLCVFRFVSLAADCRRLTKRSLNFVMICYFPKESSERHHPRPIAVTNTDNRLIAIVFCTNSLLLPFLNSSILHSVLGLALPSTRALPASMSAFTAWLQPTADFFSYFLNSKKLSTASRCYLIALLQRISMPARVGHQRHMCTF